MTLNKIFELNNRKMIGPEIEVHSTEAKTTVASLELPNTSKSAMFFEFGRNLELERILGCIYGHCLGSAYGQQTTSWKKNLIRLKYIIGKVPFPRNVHVLDKQSKCGDLTNPVNQVMMIMRMLSEIGLVDQYEFANRLKEWICSRDLKASDQYIDDDSQGYFESVVSRSDFTNDPCTAAKEIWLNSEQEFNSNEALSRTVILGIFDFAELIYVENNSELICSTTHYDPRCIVSCIIVCRSIAKLIQSSQESFKNFDIEDIIQDSVSHGLGNVKHSNENFNEQIRFYAKPAKISEFKLDEDSNMRFVLKGLASALFGM
jgi:ADP-ribosylglycohydrolase